jgi:hypothetical protein
VTANIFYFAMNKGSLVVTALQAVGPLSTLGNIINKANSDDFTKYVDPVSRSLTCLALSDSQRIIVAGTDEAKFKLLNTLGQSKFTVSLIYTTSDDDKVEGPVLRLFFKPDKTNIIGVVPHGIFTWNFESGGALDVAIVKKTTRKSTFDRREHHTVPDPWLIGTLTACAYIRNMDLIVAGDSEGLVTLSSSDSLDHPDKFQCDAPIVALSTHPTQPLIAIATETEIIVWVCKRIKQTEIGSINNTCSSLLADPSKCHTHRYRLVRQNARLLSGHERAAYFSQATATALSFISSNVRRVKLR